MTTAMAYAVFAEHSPQNKKMQPGMNPRIFNKTEVLVGDGIELDSATGIITLSAGIYHISGFSAVNYFTGDEPKEMVTVRSPANGGYCRLRNVDIPVTDGPDSNSSALCVGSVTTANCLPSLIETYVTVKENETMRILLEHQSGSKVDDVYLEVFTENSPYHVFARICIRRI